MADYSGTITAGGTAQTAAVADAMRNVLVIQNNSANDLWYNFGIAAVVDQPSFLIEANQMHIWPLGFLKMISQFVSIIGATTGQAFTIKDSRM